MAEQGQAARAASTKALPCAVVSRWRSFDGAKAAASSATARKRLVVAALGRAMGMGEQHRVAIAAALGEHDGEPGLAASRRP